jgi:hypothetical protein
MLVSLRNSLIEVNADYESKTHRDKEAAPEKAVPGVFWIVCTSMIKEKRPLVSMYGHFTAAKFFLYPGRC